MTLSSGRVEFTEATRKMVMEEAGYCCANPGCRMHLLEFYTEQNKTRKLGDVAHIYSAVSLSGSGPRSNPHMTPEQLSAQTNGIYLCTTCHRRVDNCELMFPAEHLFQWKREAQQSNNPEGRDRWKNPGYGRTTLDDCRETEKYLHFTSPFIDTINQFCLKVQGTQFRTFRVDHKIIVTLWGLARRGIGLPTFNIYSHQFRNKIFELQRIAEELIKLLPENTQLDSGSYYKGDEPPFLPGFPSGVLVYIDGRVQALSELIQQWRMIQLCWENEVSMYQI